MNLFGVLSTVLVVVLLAGLGLVVWRLVEVWRDERWLVEEWAWAKRQRIERDASLVAERLRQQVFRVQEEMMRQAVKELRRRS